MQVEVDRREDCEGQCDDDDALVGDAVAEVAADEPANRAADEEERQERA